jgi:hypothetical protein
VWYGQSLLPGSTSAMLAPINAAPMWWPTNASLMRQPSRSRVSSHSSLCKLKIFIAYASPISISCATTSSSGCVASISYVHVARSSGSTSSRWLSMSDRSSAVFP